MKTLKQQLSEEWQKPKAKNLKKKTVITPQNGLWYFIVLILSLGFVKLQDKEEVIIGEPRDYDKINFLHNRINQQKQKP